MSKAIKQNAVNWFELYVSDFERAKKFYEATLQTTLAESKMEGCRMGIFPFNEKDGIGGAITKMDCMSPGGSGTMVYLNVEGDLDGVLKRTPTNGGEVIKSRLGIGEHGFIGVIKDTEGNMVGLHSMV
ncbi:MAG TPA: VOC family protein [Verrucomicrobiota bacterium]|nr:VOC family protein [Verrucomicrobiota bacterium]